ncbi:MAG TPA: DNA translocase FtsK 4TM domain-containing protein [Steroidobacteraceae bacterium]|nr:DNA translocase FtsK 4TM domain-containing protein [Steroidobacteraceae bacterium]
MAESGTQERMPLRLSAPLVRGLRESGAIALLVIALVLCVALLTFSPDDRGFSSTGLGGIIAGAAGGARGVLHAGVHNRVGPVGAWFADALYWVFGRAAYLLPVMLGFGAWRLAHRRTEPPPPASRLNLALRVVGFLVLMVASCALAALHWSARSLPAGAGGALGSAAGASLAAGLDLLGATLLLLAAWMAGAALAFDVSWLTVMDRLGQGTWALARWLRERHFSAREREAARAVAQARSVAMQASRTRAAGRVTPRIEPPAPAPPRSERAERERQVPLFDPPGRAQLPALELLDEPPNREPSYSAEALEAMSRLVELKLRDFGVEVEVVAVHPGPVVTRFEMRPAPGVKANQITNLSKDLARALSTISVRVVEVIPGKSVMGLEIPNEKRELVTLGEILRSKSYEQVDSPLALALGKDIGGVPMVADLQRMPHLLIAGTTGSGKSVAINAMVLSLVYKASAEHVRLIMIDPKMLELSVYEGIPHLLAPVVTDMKQAANALRWGVAEMERRYQLMAALGVRNIAGYNRRVKDAIAAGKPIIDPVQLQRAANDPGIDQSAIPALEPLPFVVVVIDELADLMMIVGKKVEELIARLAQKARASGIHLVLATQRPSVDVITGLIKANIPCRIAFQVSAKVDSRTILDQMGAESLLGHGDMLYLPPGTSMPIRIHGAFVSDQEVHRVVEALKQSSQPSYLDEVLRGPSTAIAGMPGEDEDDDGDSIGAGDAERDPLYDEAVGIVTRDRKPSISYVQRRLKIGYNRAARMLEAMELAGIVGPLQSNGSREVLAPPAAGD